MTEDDEQVLEEFLATIRTNTQAWLQSPEGPRVSLFGAGYLTKEDIRKDTEQLEWWLDWYVSTLRSVVRFADKKESEESSPRAGRFTRMPDL